ncbi:nuclear factor of kappa light polypeptide gene enhancer in B-cells inhibitor, alpha a [Pimephales promelas]|uniref:nuclear factor of kappa light polypeptide gene enhancer in B-cells inhibitor, alpha a n=1 Tax=Pimephales promelas TaxID=90988 RepID=UPI00195590FB|nr:nuclear factor of kappa light polypeptide gene enhancer in B-cells inhibitor, alpha a [Pimephales promelas]KAG1964711.1 nuclear factor NF-kappa-B p105 subunit isoform 2 proprotein [Pimephales promelas]
MDFNRAARINYMDCDLDEMDTKNRKMQHCEDRVDSGVDSLKEDEYRKIVEEMENLSLPNASANPKGMCEPWTEEVTEDGDTYLHLAIIHEAEDYAIQIIKQCQNDPFLNRQNNQRQTALHLAVITEQPHMVDRLLKAGCDPRLVDQSGNTALHIACKRGSLSCFSVLTQIQTQHLRSILTFPNYSGHTCIHIAAVQNYLSMVESLVQLGADVNAKEQCSGRTSLHLAVDTQNLELVHTLIALGADVNSLTYGGYTPYHLTFGRHNSEIQRQLYSRTAQELRPMPESESEDSEEELSSDDDCMYDDIQFCGR